MDNLRHQPIDAEGVRQILDKIRPLTMVPDPSLQELTQQVRAILEFNLPGDMVECGVWRGGAAFLMAEVLRQADVRDRKVWLFDSFEGLPPPDPIDGAGALAYPRMAVRDNARASLEEVKGSASRLGLDRYTTFVKGWFEETLPVYREQVGPISLLRIDCDWYAGVRCCLENLYDQVVEGGFVILDDYYAWDGCATAVHEFLGQRQLAYRLESIVGKTTDADNYYGALFRKGKTTWKTTATQMVWRDMLRVMKQNLKGIIPPDTPFLLVDQDLLRSELDQRHALPFLEKEGIFWGPPPDDETAIKELERARSQGIKLIVFAWPAFWWLDHYATFYGHLQANFRRVLASERLIIFDLQS